MKVKNQQSIDPYLDSVRNFENEIVDPSSIKAIRQQIIKTQTNNSISWFSIPKYKFVAASVAFIILINLVVVIKVSSRQHGSDSASNTAKILMDDYNISR